MFGRNYVSSPFVTQMRQELLQTKKNEKHYKYLYSSECRTSSDLKKKLVQCEIKFKKLQEQLQKVSKSQPKCTSNLPRTRKRKDWNEIRGERTKYRRLNDYKDIIFNALQQIDHCHRAEISIWLNTQRFHFCWYPSDFQKASNVKNNIRDPCENVLHDHSYAFMKIADSEDQEIKDMDFSEIYDSVGNWKQIHIRRLIHVMDCFRISHDAYHEIRMVSEGHLPPIGRITAEKQVMSDEIPYVKHPTVRYYDKTVYFSTFE